MTLLAFAVTLFIIVVAIVGVAAPARLLALLRSLQSAKGMVGIAVIRIVYGLSLYLVGPASASPQAIRGLGIFIIVAGLITPFIGVARFQALTEAVFSRGPRLVRIWCVFAALFGFVVLTQLPSPL